jgi:dipeptidyl aminopeptidase/acylaminoacyl peptidase
MSRLVLTTLVLASGIPIAALAVPTPPAQANETGRFQSSDLYKLRSVSTVALSPDETRVAYMVVNRDRSGRPYSQVWVMELATGKAGRLGGEKESASNPVWSRDGQWLAFQGSDGNSSGLIVAHPDGSARTFLAPMKGTNSPLPGQGENVTWSPDSKKIAFVSSTPGPETGEASGDPMVITRYLYKPTAGEGLSHFNDNRRLHIFIVDAGTRQVRQATDGTYNEHSIDWSPDAKEILFASNREPNSDEFFNYDLFALNVADGGVRRLTATESCEYAPRWSPDGTTIAFSGTRRGLTDRETTMEDTHIWLMNADGTDRREIGAAIDNRQSHPQWGKDSAVYFTAQERGSVHLYRMRVPGGAPEMVVNELGAVESWSVGKDGIVVYSYTSPGDMAELYLKSATGTRQLTDLNTEVMRGKALAEVEPLWFTSNDNRFEVEAFLTKPLGLTADSKHPLIVSIHGGPHGQNGPAFNFEAQVYAGRGWATLNVNYRGSTGYGQKFADAVFGDQDGNEGQDVLYGVSAAVRRNLWIDRDRMGIEGVSYGGQLSDWLITQTNEFKAAIPIAGISNLISYNYMTYYNQYEEMEFGQFLHQGNLMDTAWERSALKHVANVHTPTMLMHGENDPDVPIAEAEQYYIALKDVGVETVFVRYPREGHGLAETKHQVDRLDRSIAWYEKHFPPAGAQVKMNVQP